MEPTQNYETSAFNTQTPGKYPEDNLSALIIFLFQEVPLRYVRTSVSIKFKLMLKHRYFSEGMKIHVNFTCRQWVSIDNPSVPLNVIRAHVNAKHRQAQ
jgi:hypothetical protein